MPLSWNEIKDRALAFSREWADETSEDAEAKSFWDAFFMVFNVPRRRVATFEQPVKKSDGHGGYIDLLWKGILLVEHKSRGKDLDRAFKQAKDYFPGLKDRDLPRYILVSDFAHFRLYDLEEGEQHEFPIKDFYKHVRLFGFVAGYTTTAYKEQDPVNINAAEQMGKLHDKLKAMGYDGHELEVYLVRLLFCLFADDTSIFERRQFQDLIEQRTTEDGQDLAQWLGHLFEVLNSPPEKRLKRLDEQLANFRYVNGSLFAEHLRTADFDREMREILLECCGLDWSRISPAIFGALDLMPSKVVSTNLNLIVPGAELFHFGILSSALHMAWVRSVGGRLKSDYRYSAGIVYNNFPWPTDITKKQTQDVETAAQAVLEARAKHPRSSLADLYDPLTMPADLVKAHRKLDAVVDAAYSKKKFSGDADRTAFLFAAYEKLVNPLVAAKPKRKKAVA
jgi:hypothetical protein